MKKLLFAALLLSCFTVFSQDMILMKTGTQIKCNIESENDSTIFFTEEVAGSVFRKELRKAYVQGVYKGYFDGPIQRLPSTYLKRAGNFQTASILVAVVFGGLGAVVGNTPGAIVAASGGVLAFALHLAGNAQLNYAGKALEKIKIENGGIAIPL